MTSSVTPIEAPVSGPKHDDDEEDLESTVDSAEGADAARLPPEPGEQTGVDDADDDDEDDDEDADDDTADGVASVAAAGQLPWWWRNLPRLIASAAVLTGWGFVGWHEHFRITPPTVFLCLGWLAVVEAVLFLWRTGFSATDDDPGDVAWWKPAGEADELLREKRSLLKAIKEIEFDHEMGKLTDNDAGEIVAMYRARAIEVIKAIDVIEAAHAGGTGGSVKDEIERELKARLEVRGKGRNKKRDKAKAGKERAS
jgi:hypothetical protein